MSLENVAAGLFNFDPTRGLQAGTSMGAQMMQIALQSQQQQLDAGAKWDQAMLSADRNALARRTQMFNEMTSNLNRFDEQARQKSAEAWATGGGGGVSSGGGSSVSYPQSEASPVPAMTEPKREFSLSEGAGFNSAPATAEPIAPTNEPSITTNIKPETTPIGGGTPAQAPGGKPFRMASGQSAAPNQFVTAPDASMSGSAPMPTAQGQVAASRGESPVSFSEGPSMTPNVSESRPRMETASLPNYLETDANSKVAPAQLHGYMRQRLANSQLNGFVPKDGERFGIKTGSPDEWADYFTGLANVESGFGAKVTGDVGRFNGNSNGLFQLSPGDATNHGIRDSPFTMTELQDPTFNADAAVKIHEKLVLGDGVIAGRSQDGGYLGASRYWGPLRRGVTPQTQGVVAEARGGMDQRGADTGQGQIPGMAGGPGAIDAGLFPQQQQAPDFEQFPEYRATNEARTAYQQTLSEKMQNTTKMAELRTQLMQVDQEMLAKDAEASAFGLRQADPLYKVAINPLRMQRSKIENEILGIQSQNQQVLEREKILEKSAKDADAAWKIVQDRQRAFQRAAPDAAASASPDVIFDRYVDADPRTRMKMKASFVNDKEMMARLNVADEFLKSEGQGTVADDRTWKIGGSDYTLAELVEFYDEPARTYPDGKIKPNPVKEFVEDDPKLKKEVMSRRRSPNSVAMGTSGELPPGITIDPGIDVQVTPNASPAPQQSQPATPLKSLLIRGSN